MIETPKPVLKQLPGDPEHGREASVEIQLEIPPVRVTGVGHHAEIEACDWMLVKLHGAIAETHRARTTAVVAANRSVSTPPKGIELLSLLTWNGVPSGCSYQCQECGNRFVVDDHPEAKEQPWIIECLRCHNFCSREKVLPSAGG